MSNSIWREGDIASSTTSNMAWKAIYFWLPARATYRSLVLKTAPKKTKRRVKLFLTHCDWCAASKKAVPLATRFSSAYTIPKQSSAYPNATFAAR